MVIIVAFIAPYILPMSLRNIAPPLGLAVIFYWRRCGGEIYLPLWAVIICGVLFDISQLMPIGVGISACLLLYWLARPSEERDEVQSFASHNMRHIWVSAVVMLWIYLFMSLLQGQFFPLEAPLFQWLALILSYPLIYAFCHAIHQHMDNSTMRHI